MIQRLGVQAQASPRAFLLRVGGYALFGYAYMLGVLALTVALTVAAPNALTIKLGLMVGVAAGGMALLIIRSLWIRLEPPTGLKLQREEAPALFALVAEVRRALDAPEFQELLLVPEYNAAVVQTPRLGIFGWHRNYLLLGLPLLRSLEREEFRAVLAHEFGHLSRAHGRFGNWLYRLRRSWERIFAELFQHRPGKLAFLLMRFVDWFWPRFNAHAFVLARANEYEADAAAGRAAGRATLARALTRLQVDGPLLQEKFWPAVFRRANTEAEPPANVFGELGEALGAGPEPADADRWLRASLLLETNNADTHPCLKDRLRALGELPAEGETNVSVLVPGRAQPTAAEELLAAALPRLEQQLSREWTTAIAADWQKRHAEAVRLREELATLESRTLESQTDDATATIDALWQRARVALDLGGDEAALPMVEQILVLQPGHSEACYIRGRHFLTSDDPRGVDFVERALAGNPRLTPGGCNLLYGHFARTGQRTRLRPLEERVDRFNELEAAARRERAVVSVADPLLPPELSPEVRTQLSATLGQEPAILAAHVVRKAVMHFPESPCFVVALTLDQPWWKPISGQANQQLVSRVVEAVKLEGYRLVFVREGNLTDLGHLVEEVADSLVYRREDR